MPIGGLIMGALYLVALSVAPPAGSTPESQDGFTLAGVIPNDVFLYVAERHNPERGFLDDYWEEVFAALAQSGVAQDAVDLLGAFLGGKTEVAQEVERLKERAAQLLGDVDWRQLAGRERVFAERFSPEVPVVGPRPPVFMADMIWLSRGSAPGAEQNYARLVAILEAVAEELNRITGGEALTVKRTEQRGARLASVNLLALAPGAPELPLSIGLRDDVIIVALRKRLLDDVLGLMEGKSSPPALGADSRFQAAFAQLPPAEDSMTFFDLRALLKPLLATLSMAVDLAQAPGDVYRNADMSAEDSRLNVRALSAYQCGDYKEALALTEKLYAAAPQNSIVLYNLACFSALVGKREAALSWLEKAVDGGFYAPTKITTDSDLDSLRSEPRYKAALAKAGELAAAQRAEDVIVNSADTGEAFALNMQAWQAYQAQEYEQGLRLAEQAYAVAPQDSRVLYNLACLHALLGHKDKALEFLAAAVAGGFYCPQHLAKDPDLDSLRSDERYQAASTLARAKATQLASRKTGEQIAWVRLAIDKLADAVGIVDCVATVESTDGYAVWEESVASLIPDAQSKPGYKVLAGKKPLTEFDRFLPQETASFSVSSGFDPRALYQFLEDSVRQLGPPGEELLARWTELQEQVGVNVRKDIVDWVDGGFVRVGLSDGRGSVWLVKVTDEGAAREKIGAAIEFFTTKLPEFVAKNPALAPLAVMTSMYTSPLERADLPGFQNLHLAMLPQPPVWGVAEGYLVVASSADAAALCLATARGEHPGIRKNAQAMAEAIIPDGPFTSVSLTDERKFGEDLAKGIGIASMVSGMLGSFMPDPKVRPVLGKITGLLTKVASVARKIDFYKSTASLTTFDGQKWHTRQVTHYLSPAERRPRSSEPVSASSFHHTQRP